MQILNSVFDEINRQDNKFGKNRDLHPLKWQSILLQEVGEVAKEVFQADSLQDSYRDELIQVAAVAMQAVLNFDRQTIMDECIGCDQKFYQEDLVEDDAGENYCPDCWEVLAPVMKAEYEELKANGNTD